jgi:hypothetical protein
VETRLPHDGFTHCLSACQKVKPPLYFYVTSDGLSAKGRWVPSNPKDKAAFPSETEITCDLRSKVCIEATAEYFTGHPHVSTAFYQVVMWGVNGLIATSGDGICMNQTLLISFPDKSISNRHTIKKLNDDQKEACKFFISSGTETEEFVIKNSGRWIADPYGSGEK